MMVELGGHLTTFADASRGAVIRFASGKDEYLGLKIWSRSGEHWVALDPGLPKWKGRPAILFSQHWGVEPVFEISDAVFRPNFGHLELANTAIAEVGDLALCKDGRTLLMIGADSDAVYADLATGEAVGVTNAEAIFKRWSIVRMVDGKAVTLMEFGKLQLAKPVAA